MHVGVRNTLDLSRATWVDPPKGHNRNVARIHYGIENILIGVSKPYTEYIRMYTFWLGRGEAKKKKKKVKSLYEARDDNNP